MFRVLIVDDEIYAVRGIIDGVDWNRLDVDQVYEAYHVQGAKNILDTEHIDFMICEIDMPEENGFDLLNWVNECYPELTTIFLTCHANFKYA